MGLRVESIIDGEDKKRKDKEDYPKYDLITKILLYLFSIQKC